jgi:cell division protein FtsN
MLVGRQWARSTTPTGRVAVDADRPGDRATAERRSGERPRRLGERERDDATPQIQEKLTFYQTLTAPLTAGPPPASKARPAPASAGTPMRDASPPEGAGTGANAGASYTVQVAAFRTREQADALREKLGSDAYIAEVERGSPVKYRVRVGVFTVRTDAEAAAARLRAERHLAAFVTKR